MIKIKSINRKLCKKLTAFTLATSLSITSAPVRIMAQSNDNMCYEEETIAEYKTIAGDYKVVKYWDNSIKITETNINYENELTMDNVGNVKIKVQDKKHFGLFTDYKRYSFKIKEFNSTNLDINDSEVNDEIVQRVIDSLQNYIGTNSLNDVNYLELLGEDLMDPELISDYNESEIKNISKDQYNDTYYNYINDLNENGLEISTSSDLVLGSALVGTLNAGELAAVGDVICPELILLELLIAGLYVGEVYVSSGNALSLNDISNTYAIDNEDLSDNTTWISITDATDIIENNYLDDDPNNDYYKAVISRAENNVYINFADPMSIQEAAEFIRQFDSLLPLNNIYTYQASDAVNVISTAGGIAGTSFGGMQYTNCAECHAFYRPYDQFDPNTLTYDLDNLRLKNNVRPGIYYWHYHFLGKRVSMNMINENHIFFGVPVIVTQNDIDRYLSDSQQGNAINLDNYEDINYKYSRSRQLKK
ncbi:MAG: hypothetical protein IKF19_04400 [Bacilli bacterium]|nr:hypothetical protein [Bacilli bacterium]